jgi:ADP-ribosylglycohydrolase
MIGAIIGDIIGSPYEGSHNAEVSTFDFPLFNDKSRFTDDTVLTCATADAILDSVSTGFLKFDVKYREWAKVHPDRGYGSGFKKWVANENTINDSYANGCMMRCSPIPLFWNNDYALMLQKAVDSVKHTHNSPESIRGVTSICTAISLALKGESKDKIKEIAAINFGHMTDAGVYEVRCCWPKNTIRCNIYAPQALIAFLLSHDYESTIRNAVFMRGDTDTTAAIAGAIAEAFYGVQSIPQWMIDEAKLRMTPDVVLMINEFYLRIGSTNENYRNFLI